MSKSVGHRQGLAASSDLQIHQTRVQKLQKSGIRAKADLRNEKIGFKIREHTLKRVPYMLVVGDREMEAGEIAVRTRKGKDLGKFKVDDFIAYIQLQQHCPLLYALRQLYPSSHHGQP